MNQNRLIAAALALALWGSALPAALAEEGTETVPFGGMPQVEVPAPNGGYATEISLNGAPVESFDFSHEVEGWGSQSVTWKLSELDQVPAGYVPMRAIVQADHGSCFWDQEGDQGWFTLENTQITVLFGDLSVTVNDAPVEGVSAVLKNGVTYLPVSLLGTLEGYSVEDVSADGVERYEITTPNGAPLVKLAYSLAELADMGVGMESDAQELEDFYGESHGIRAEYMTEAVAFLPMMTTPDTLILGKVAPGKEKDLEAALEAYRATQEETFTWYLNQNLPKVQNAQFVTQGEWFLFLIGENAEETVEAFRAAAAELE